MIMMVVGGARSGKSSFAEKQFIDKENVVYIATSRVEDDEMKDRVEHHKKSRPDTWRTFEDSYDIHKAIGNEDNYLLDCLTVLTSNIMFDMTFSEGSEVNIDSDLQKRVEDRIFYEVSELMDAVVEKGYDLIIVTNEVGYSLVPESHIGRVFRDIQGRVNQRVAERSDQVYLVSCGIPVRIK